MLVIVNDQTFSPEKDKVMLVLNDLDKRNIAGMGDDNCIIVSYPNSSNREELDSWVNNTMKEHSKEIEG